MPDRKRPRVGEILVEAGVIDRTQLKAALGEQARWGRPLGATLIKLGFVDERELVRALAGQLGMPMASLDGKRIPADVLALVPRELADRAMVIPLFVKREGTRSFLYVGVEDPGNLELFDDLAFRTGMEIKPVLVGPSDLCEAIDRCYHRATAEEAPATPAATSAPRPSSLVTPGTEELARHWSGAGEAAAPTAARSSEPLPAPSAEPLTVSAEPFTELSSEPDAALLAEPDAALSAEPDAALSTGPAVVTAAEPSAVQSVAQPAAVEAGPARRASVSSSVAWLALAELLIEKGVLTRDELDNKLCEVALALERAGAKGRGRPA